MKNNKGILLVLFGVLFIAAPLLGSSIEHPFSGMIKSGTTIKPAVPTDLVEVDAIEFTEDDVDPTCASGNYNLYADLSETVIKLCQDGVSAIIGTGGASQWTDTGTVIHPAELTDDVSLGSATLINAAKLSIDGDADQEQLAIQGNATQTTSIMIIENSAGGELFHLNNSGQLGIQHTATFDNDHGMQVTSDAAGFGDIKGLSLQYTTGALAATDHADSILVNIDQSATLGGDVTGFEVLATDSGAADVFGLNVGVGISPIRQNSGAFGAVGFCEVETTGPVFVDCVTAFNSSVTDVQLWVANSDIVNIGHATTFEELAWLWDTVAGNPGIQPTFEYSTGAGPTWTVFAPTDATNGARNNGIMEWDSSNLAGWSSESLDGDAAFWIRITRTCVPCTGPTEDLVEVAAPVTFSWDTNGDLHLNDIQSGTAQINAARLSVDGDSDQVQFAIQGNGTQTTNLIEHENSGGTVLYSLDNIGIETVFGGVEFLDDDVDPACAAGNYNIYADLSETRLKKCVNGVVSDVDGGAVAASLVVEGVPINSGSITTAILKQSFDVSTETIQNQDVFLRADGLKMYVVDMQMDEVNEYDLSIAWDVSSSAFNDLIDISTEELSPTGVFFRADGLKMYVSGTNGREINEYDLSSAWDVTTASALQLFDPSTQEMNPGGVFFKPDGLKMYITGSSSTDANEYDLSVAWDVTTSVFLQAFDVLSQETTPTDIQLSSDGLKMYIIGSTTGLSEYDLAVAWDVSTAVFFESFSTVASTGISFSPGRLKLYSSDVTANEIDEYDIAGVLEGTFNVNGAQTTSVPTDGDSVLAILENSEPHAAASTNETAQLRFGLGGDLDVARIVVGKEDDYDPGAGENDSFMALYTDKDGTATEAVRFNSDGSTTLAVDLAVTEGGSGAGTFTDGGILLGSGTGAFTPLGAAANGQIPIGDGATDPVLATITGTANEVTVTNGAGSITLDIPTSPTLTGTTTLDSAGADTVAIATFNNTAGNFQIFRVDVDPEASLTGSIGDLAVDSVNGTIHLKQSGSASNTGWIEIGGSPTFKSYSLSNPGSAGTFYIGGHYAFDAADSNLTIGGTVVQTFGTAGQAHGSHAFAVASGAGGTDLVLTVTGVSITDAGVRNGADSEIIVADADMAITDQYFETSKKWLGQITYTLTGSSGTFDFNYGFVKYDDFGNMDFTITDFEGTGEARANETGLNIELLHHEATAFTYNASAFVPNQTALVSLATDYSTDNDVASGDGFAYKRTGLSTAVAGASGEGVIIRVTTAVNNSINDASFHIGVLIR